jgi:hypothetical protein
MALSDLVATAATISDGDQLAQTSKLIERTFGTPAAQLGTLAMLDGRPALTFTHNGADHVLTWERDRNSAPFFRVDGEIVPGLGGEGSALRLLRWLDTK